MRLAKIPCCTPPSNPDISAEPFPIPGTLSTSYDGIDARYGSTDPDNGLSISRRQKKSLNLTTPQPEMRMKLTIMPSTTTSQTATTAIMTTDASGDTVSCRQLDSGTASHWSTSNVIFLFSGVLIVSSQDDFCCDGQLNCI